MQTAHIDFRESKLELFSLNYQKTYLFIKRKKNIPYLLVQIFLLSLGSELILSTECFIVFEFEKHKKKKHFSHFAELFCN